MKVARGLVLASILPLAAGRASGLQLVLSPGSTCAERILAVPDGRFTHVYVHSVHRTLVEERFRIEPGGVLHLYELRYQSPGAGMPTDGFRIEGDAFVLSLDRSFRELPIMVSPVPGHGILVGGTFIPFTECQRPGGRVVLSARTSSHTHPRR